jgi:hypothetical protein
MTVEFGRQKVRSGRWWLGLAGAALLLLTGGVRWLTTEPAPYVRVRWSVDVTAAERTARERQYLLVNPREINGPSIGYDLLDTSRRNIAALVGDPAAADTNDIDRSRFVISVDADEGRAWIWLASRLPGLRHERLREVLALGLLAMTVVCWSAEIVARQRAQQGPQRQPDRH